MSSPNEVHLILLRWGMRLTPTFGMFWFLHTTGILTMPGWLLLCAGLCSLVGFIMMLVGAGEWLHIWWTNRVERE